MDLASEKRLLLVSTSIITAAPATVLVIGPAVSWDAEMGTMPAVGSNPTVGLNPTTPLTCAGQMMDPLVSVPSANVASPAAIAAPEPELEPQGDRSRICGFLACPPTEDQPLTDWVDRKLAHWLKLVLPRMTAPPARKFATIGLSCWL